MGDISWGSMGHAVEKAMRYLSYTVEGSMTRLQHDILLLQHTRLGSLACSTINHLEKRDLVASPLKGSL